MEVMKQVAERPARVLIAVESDTLKHKLFGALTRFSSKWIVDVVEPIGPFDEYSIVAALATAVKKESDIVLYASAIHDGEAVASHFLGQRDLEFFYLHPDSGAWLSASGDGLHRRQPRSGRATQLLDFLS